MFIPLISPWLKYNTQRLERRKGGGGGGRGGGGGSSGGKSGGGTSSSGGKTGGGTTSSGGKNTGSSGSGSSSGSTRGTTTPIKSATGSTTNARSYGTGSTRISSIPSGQPFAGRSVGGGTRDNVFGNRQYGSGYPGTSSAGIAGRGFPFGFWPIAFGAGAGFGLGSQYHSREYGDSNNSSRPGGPLFDAPFQPAGGANTYRILADNTTVQSLISSITANCSLSTTSISAVLYNGSDPFQPKPEQVIQYYRSSSISLTLDGYNNSAAFSNDTNAPDTPLPSGLNTTFLDCLNQTIGAAAPLLDAATPRVQASGLLGLIWLAVFFMRWCA